MSLRHRCGRAALLTSLAALAACADDRPSAVAPPPTQVAAAPTGRARGCAPLFISPAGEPFRADPGKPDGPCPLRAWFTGADANGDGALTRTEFREDALRFFAQLDLDGNGFIDGAELKVYEQRIVPEILGRGGGPSAALDARPRLLPAALQMGGGGMGGGGRGGGRGGQGDSIEAQSGPKARLQSGAGLARFGLLDEPEPVASADLDFDGRITRAEFATRADQRFDHLDEAEAGRLTYPELETRMRARRGDRPQGAPSSGGGRHGGGGRGGRGGGGGFGGPPQA